MSWLWFLSVVPAHVPRPRQRSLWHLLFLFVSSGSSPTRPERLLPPTTTSEMLMALRGDPTCPRLGHTGLQHVHFTLHATPCNLLPHIARLVSPTRIGACLLWSGPQLFGQLPLACFVFASVFVFNVLHVGGVVAQEEKTTSTVTSAGPTDWVRYPQLGCRER